MDHFFSVVQKSFMTALISLLPAAAWGFIFLCMRPVTSPVTAPVDDANLMEWRQQYYNESTLSVFTIAPIVVFFARFISAYPPQRMRFEFAVVILTLVAVAFRFMSNGYGAKHHALVLTSVVATSLLLIWRGFGPHNPSDPLLIPNHSDSKSDT